MTMDDLAAFISARLDEDGAAARAATPGPWHWVDPGVKTKLALVSGGYSPENAARWDTAEWGWNYVVRSLDDRPSIADTEHIARRAPDRALREVAAMRAILAFWADPFGNWSADQADAARAQKERMLRHLAAVWSDHPDYRAEWSPGHIAGT